MKREIDLKIEADSVITQVTPSDVEDRMILLRQQPVLLDYDVATLYGVKTREINQAVRNNPNKFPPGYVFLLNNEEKIEVVKNFDRLSNLKFSSVAPTAFTERGLYMLATILKTDRAVYTTLAIVDTFVQVRELARTMEALQTVTDGSNQQKSLLEHTGTVLSEMVSKNLRTESSETEIELNFAVVKIKHKFIRKA